jgi:uncharacterized membrane protein
MTAFFALPGWNGLHPTVIHFPITLLLVAPVFVLFGAFLTHEKARIFEMAALILMILGTLAIFAARSTGEASAKLGPHAPALSELIEQHAKLAETTSIVFSVLTAAFAAMVYGLGLVQRERAIVLAKLLPLVFLVLYCAGAVLLVDTARRGGRLAHEFGIHAGLQPASTPVDASNPADNN